MTDRTEMSSGPEQEHGPVGDHAAERPVHAAVLYRSVEDAVRRAADVLADARRRGRGPVLAVLRADVEAGVRRRLGPDAADVVFLAVGSRPAGPVVRDFLERSDGAHSPTVVIAPDPSDDPWAVACLETEVLAAADVVGSGEERTCLFPRVDPFERVARVTHPLLAVDGDGEDEGGLMRPNAAHRTQAQLLLEEPAAAHLDPTALTRDVVPHLDPDLRVWLADRARESGLRPDVVDQVVLAAHEALRTGAESRSPAAEGAGDRGLGVAAPTTDGLPATRLYLHRPARGAAATPALVLDVDAAALPGLVADRLPAEALVKGLWVADASCPDISITVHPLSAGHSRIRVAVVPDVPGR